MPRELDPPPDIGPAVVVPCADGGADPKARRRFIDESRLAVSLDHPNIAPIYEAGEVYEQLFLGMRFVPGPDLADNIYLLGAVVGRSLLAF